MFQSCFLEQFPYLWCGQLSRVGLQGSCFKHHSGLCILGIGGGESVILSQAVPGQMLFNYDGPGLSNRGCSHWYLSAFGFFRDSTCWCWLSVFFTLCKKVCWLSGSLCLQVTSHERIRASPLAVAAGKIVLRFFCEKENFWLIFAIFF